MYLAQHLSRWQTDVVHPIALRVDHCRQREGPKEYHVKTDELRDYHDIGLMADSSIMKRLMMLRPGARHGTRKQVPGEVGLMQFKIGHAVVWM